MAKTVQKRAPKANTTPAQPQTREELFIDQYKTLKKRFEAGEFDDASSIKQIVAETGYDRDIVMFAANDAGMKFKRGRSLSVSQVQIIESMLHEGTHTVAEIAKEANTSQQTVYKHLKENAEFSVVRQSGGGRKLSEHSENIINAILNGSSNSEIVKEFGTSQPNVQRLRDKAEIIRLRQANEELEQRLNVAIEELQLAVESQVA